MGDVEPEPEYGWHMKNPYGYEMHSSSEGLFYQYPNSPWFGRFPLTDEILESWGCTRFETEKSRIARLEWRVRQLEQELERRQDLERERSEYD